MSRRIEDYPLVRIRFIDLQTHQGWRSIHEIDDCSTAECVAVGYLLHDQIDPVKIAMTLSTDDKTGLVDQVNGVFCIPKNCIIETFHFEEFSGTARRQPG